MEPINTTYWRRQMGTIIGRSRKDGPKSFTAQIVIKKDGVIIHREAQTFDRKPAANAWIVKREAEGDAGALWRGFCPYSKRS